MRVLHLIDAAGPQATATTAALLGDALGRLPNVEQHALLLGGAALGRAAARAGLERCRRLPVPAGRAWLGAAALRRAVTGLRPFDLVHCWSIGSLSAAVLLWGDTPRLLTLTTVPRPRAVRWLRVLTAHGAGRTVLLPISGVIRRALLGGGIAPSAVHVLRPGLDFSRIDRAARDTWRAAWGITSERTWVVALLSDPPQSGDALVAAMAVGLAGAPAADPADRFRLLLCPDQRWGLRARRIHEGIACGASLETEPLLAAPWKVLAGCDACLAIGPDAGGLSMLWAMAANVPIVAEATHAVSEIVEDRHSALLAGPGRATALAHRLQRLRADPQLAWRLRDTARHEAYSYFPRSGYCRSLHLVYEQALCGDPIAVPAPEVTGGLRFAGRA